MLRATKLDDYNFDLEFDWENLANDNSPFGTFQDFKSALDEDGYIVYEWQGHQVLFFLEEDEIVKIVFIYIGYGVNILGIKSGMMVDQSLQKAYHTIEEHLGIYSSNLYKFRNDTRSIVIQSNKGDLVVLAQGDPIHTLHVGTKAATEKAVNIIRGAIHMEQFTPK